MENQVRELLHDRAEDIHLEPDIPQPVVRRARRRRLLNAAVAGTTALAVVAGAVVAFSALVNQRPDRLGATPTPPASVSALPPVVDLEGQVPAVWPETNLQDIQAAQEAAESGADTWRMDEEETAKRFAATVLGWEEAGAVVIGGEGDGPVIVRVLRGPDGDGIEGKVDLTMQRLAATGPHGVWSVLDARTEGLNVFAGSLTEDQECPFGPLVRGDSAFLCATLEGFPTEETLDAFVFVGDVVDLAELDGAPILIEDLASEDGGFRTGLTENMPPSSSVLLVLARDADGGVRGAHTERVTGGEPDPGAPWRGLWPQTTRAEAETAQEAADEGGEGYTWQLEVEGFLVRFGLQHLGWDEVSFDDSLDISDRDESGPLTIFMTNCTPPGNATFCTGDLAAQVTVERLLRRDHTGIWSVTGYEVDDVPHTGPSPTPLEAQEGLTDAVADMRQAIYDAAIAGNYDALESLINTEPLPGLEDGEGFAFSLGDVDDGRPVQERAVEYWRTYRGPQGQDLLDVMAALLTMDHSVTTVEGYTIYSWPFLVGMSPEEIRNITEEQRAQLERVYSQEDIDLIIETADVIPGYAGWRLGIDQEGRWIYFIAGD